MKHTQYCFYASKELNMNNEVGKSMLLKTKASSGSAKWLVAALIMLSVIPIAAGAFRLTQLAGGADITPAVR